MANFDVRLSFGWSRTFDDGWSIARLRQYLVSVYLMDNL